MPSLSEHQSSTTTKLLFLGDSGTGKTGALVSLVEAGYNLRVLDFDNGLDILVNQIKKTGRLELLSKVNYQTLTDTYRFAGNNPIPGATAWAKVSKTLGDWPDGLGNVGTWGTQDILVIDSLTFAGKAALRFVLNLNGRIGDLPQFQDYLTAQSMLERLIAGLYSDAIKCNVIVISHVREIGKKKTVMDAKDRPITIEEDGTRKGYAETGTGGALSPTIGRYFNAVLLADIEGEGPSARRIIRTVPHQNIGLKNPAPGALAAKLPLATGLANYFAAVRGETTQPKGTTP